MEKYTERCASSEKRYHLEGWKWCKYQDLEGSLGTKGVDQIAILAKRDEPATNSR